MITKTPMLSSMLSNYHAETGPIKSANWEGGLAKQ